MREERGIQRMGKRECIVVREQEQEEEEGKNKEKGSFHPRSERHAERRHSKNG